MFNFFNKNKVHINGLTITITKDYIDINDIDGILQTVQKVSSGYAMRRIIAYALVLSKCTDIKDFEDGSDTDINTIYNKYYLTGVMAKVLNRIKGVYILDDGLEHLDISDMSEMFVTAFESIANDMKKINYEGVDNLQSVLDRLNKEKVRQKEIFKA